MSKSMLDVTYDYLVEEDREVKFSEIWSHLIKTFSLSEEEADAKLATFYTNMMLDGRFVTLGDNIWDLRSKQKYDKIHINTNDVYSEEEASEEKDDEELEEERVLSGETLSPENEHADDDEDEESEENSKDETPSDY